jgi:hypothetical protein
MTIEDKQLNVKIEKEEQKKGGKLDPLLVQQEKDFAYS